MADSVSQACEVCFLDHSDDCSGFARAVALQFGVALQGQADDIVDTIRGGGEWRLLQDGVEAAERARAGRLVIGGLKGSEHDPPRAHGHVVIVVDGPVADDAYPTAYWGMLGGVGAQFRTINWAWREADRDNVTYAEHDV